jgi:membrane protein
LLSWLKQRGRALWGAYKRWQDDDGPLMSAAVAYYLGLSLFPLLMILISGVGWVLGSTAEGQDARQRVLDTVGEHASPIVADYVRQVLDQVRDHSSAGGRIGIIGLLLVAMAAFVQFERAFDRMWNLPPRQNRGLLAGIRWAVWERGVAFVLLLALAALVVLVFVAGLAVSAVAEHSTEIWTGFGAMIPMLRTVITLSLNAGLMTLLYRWLPRRTVAWKSAVRGGLLAAILWEVGRQLLAAVVIGQKYSNAYGVVGAFIAILLWCYYAVAVMFLGAEYVQETSSNDGGRKESDASQPGGAAE